MCNSCKHVTYLKNIAIQTDDSRRKPSLRLPIFIRSETEKITHSDIFVKLEPCKGDLGDICDIFDDCDLSSINGNDSIELHSTAKNTSKDEVSTLATFVFGKDNVSESTKIKQAFCNTARQSPDIFEKLDDNRIYCKTPSLHRYTNSKWSNFENEELSESYELMMEHFANTQSEDFKQCFKNLVNIEKISLRKNFNKGFFGKKY